MYTISFLDDEGIVVIRAEISSRRTFTNVARSLRHSYYTEQFSSAILEVAGLLDSQYIERSRINKQLDQSNDFSFSFFSQKNIKKKKY